MTHRHEQQDSGKHEPWKDGRGRRDWRAGLGLLSVIGAVWLLALDIAPVQAAPFAYVTGPGSGTMSVIDTAMNTVTATVPIGGGPGGIAANLAGTRVYVARYLDGRLFVIDTATLTVIATIPLGVDALPGAVVVNPAGTLAYVATHRPGGNALPVIATVLHTVIATVPVDSIAVNTYNSVAVNPAGTRVYVASSHLVSVIDTATHTVIATVPVDDGDTLVGVAINPAGTRVYVLNWTSNKVTVIDTATLLVIASVPLGAGASPRSVAVNPTGTRAYVTVLSTGTVAVIDTATNTVIATVPVGLSPADIAIAPGAPPPPSLALTLTGCTTCKAGDRMTVEAHVTNPGTSDVCMAVEIGVRLPDGTPINLLGEFLRVTLPGGLDTTVTVYDSIVPPGLPTRTWSFEGALLEPALGVTLSRTAQFFRVVP